MIQIDKPEEPPGVLIEKGTNARRSHSMRFTHDPEAFRRGDKTFDFDRDIYAHDAVKAALSEAQFGKCSFCESKVRHVTYGDVEHFRPKAAVRPSPEEPRQRPGYYWLAYEWTNLFLSCPLCNRRHKANLFPLRNPERRAVSHHDDVSAEEPLFLHPGADDPEEHIGFRSEVAYAKKESPRGAATIEALELNREALSEVRRDYFKTTFKEIDGLLTLLASGELTPTEQQDARRIARRLLEQNRREAREDKKPYAAMLRCGVRALERRFEQLTSG